MPAIDIKTASKVVPQCYAYTTPGVPAHDGWTKIGFTERDVETRIKEQTHTVGVKHKTWWYLRAEFMTKPYGTFTDKDFHAYLKRLGVNREHRRHQLVMEQEKKAQEAKRSGATLAEIAKINEEYEGKRLDAYRGMVDTIG